MKAIQIEIEKIKPDPNQPRKVFNQKHIEGLAESIKTEGIINPIEIDETFTIITGECRWRAAKLAGLKTVPVQLNDSKMTEYERLRRQVAENVHQSGSEDEAMNPIDTAQGYKRLLEMMGWTPSEGTSRGETGKFSGDECIKRLSKEVGVTARNIYQYLQLLDQPEFVIEKVKEGQAPSPYLEADRAPEEHREALKMKIADGKLSGQNAVRAEVTRIKKFPELAEINTFDQDKIDDKVGRIIKGVTQLGLALQDMPIDRLQEHEKKLVAENLGWLMKKIMEYVKNGQTTELLK